MDFHRSLEDPHGAAINNQVLRGRIKLGFQKPLQFSETPAVKQRLRMPHKCHAAVRVQPPAEMPDQLQSLIRVFQGRADLSVGDHDLRKQTVEHRAPPGIGAAGHRHRMLCR
jgi:hypothetical protein